MSRGLLTRTITLALVRGGGREREYLYWVEDDMSYQSVTGTISPGAHPGSYNGQYAYNDMLVVAYMSDRKGHNGVTTDGIATTLTSQEKDRPIVWGGDAMKSVVRRLTPLE